MGHAECHAAGQITPPLGIPPPTQLAVAFSDPAIQKHTRNLRSAKKCVLLALSYVRTMQAR